MSAAAWLARVPPGWRGRVLPSALRLAVFLVSTFFLWWMLASLLTPLVNESLAVSAVSLCAAVMLVTTFMMKVYEFAPLYVVGLFANRLGMIHLGTGLALGTGASTFVVAAQWGGGWARLERGAAPPDWLPTLSFGFLVLLVGAAGEEMFFRGYGFQHLLRAFGPWASVLTTSGLFAWAHAHNPSFSVVGMVNTGLFGAVFGYAYWRTRDLWLPFGMHFAWNFSLAAVGANVSGLKIRLTGLSVAAQGSLLWSGGAYGPEASLWATVMLMGALVYFWKAPQRRQERGILAGEEVRNETLARGVSGTAGAGPGGGRPAQL